MLEGILVMVLGLALSVGGVFFIYWIRGNDKAFSVLLLFLGLGVVFASIFLLEPSEFMQQTMPTWIRVGSLMSILVIGLTIFVKGADMVGATHDRQHKTRVESDSSS